MGVISPYKRVIGAGLRSRTEEGRATEVDVAVHSTQPHAGAGTPKLRPHRLTLDGAGVAAPTPLIRATCVFAWAAHITQCVRAKPVSRTRS